MDVAPQKIPPETAETAETRQVCWLAAVAAVPAASLAMSQNRYTSQASSGREGACVWGLDLRLSTSLYFSVPIFFTQPPARPPHPTPLHAPHHPAPHPPSQSTPPPTLHPNPPRPTTPTPLRPRRACSTTWPVAVRWLGGRWWARAQ